MKKISQPVVMAIPFPSSLSLPEQDKLVEELDSLQTKVAAIAQSQRETTLPLASMLPAILSRAFSGGLRDPKQIADRAAHDRSSVASSLPGQ